MSLMLPQNGFSNWTNNLSGTPGTTSGTTVTAGGSANTDGTIVPILTNLTHDVHYLQIGVSNLLLNAGNTDSLLDILVDPTGSAGGSPDQFTVNLINDLLVGFAPNIASGAAGPCYHFPIFVKSGATIGARMRSVTASQTGIVHMCAAGGIVRPDCWWSGANVTEYGITAASSRGTQHTPGSTGAFSAWAAVGSALTQACGAIQFGIQCGQTAETAVQYFWQFGVLHSVSPDVIKQIGPTFYQVGDTGEFLHRVPYSNGPIFCNLAAGSQLMVRGTCSGTAQQYDVAAYAVS